MVKSTLKYLSLGLFLASSCYSTPSNQPYKELDQVLPAKKHGWFDPSNQFFLQTFIKKRKVKVVVELGSWLGLSALFIAERLPEGGHLYAVDTWDGGVEKVYSQYYSELLAQLYTQFLSNVIHAQLTHMITPLKMTTLEGAEVLRGKISPDLVYVDACHEEQYVYDDIVAWYPFVEENGLICGDDYPIPSVARAVDRFAKERGLDLRVHGRVWWFVPKNGCKTL